MTSKKCTKLKIIYAAVGDSVGDGVGETVLLLATAAVVAVARWLRCWLFVFNCLLFLLPPPAVAAGGVVGPRPDVGRRHSRRERGRDVLGLHCIRWRDRVRAQGLLGRGVQGEASGGKKKNGTVCVGCMYTPNPIVVIL